MVLLTQEEDAGECQDGARSVEDRASFGSLEKQYHCRCPAAAAGALSGTWGGSCSASATLSGGKLPFSPVSLPTHFLFSLAFIPYPGCSFPGGSDGKESACNTGDAGLIPGPGRPLGEGNSYPLQYSCLENPMDREA